MRRKHTFQAKRIVFSNIGENMGKRFNMPEVQGEWEWGGSRWEKADPEPGRREGPYPEGHSTPR